MDAGQNGNFIEFQVGRSSKSCSRSLAMVPMRNYNNSQVAYSNIGSPNIGSQISYPMTTSQTFYPRSGTQYARTQQTGYSIRACGPGGSIEFSNYENTAGMDRAFDYAQRVMRLQSPRAYNHYDAQNERQIERIFEYE